ncbi:hypothetical protein GX51_04695 [Blastomyces parvus]|uniref:AB hydrolase-1 domain-containing protein n=1 Tax=Blastomyces parvus TaxID=2060905 RepID=A0A2B7X0P7_9EURO|nr:hypothetical protein GX51_04695 [Blastomyces parvus]
MSPISDLRAYLLRPFVSSTNTETATTGNPDNCSPEAPKDELPKPRFRLDNDTSDTLTLPDGRKLGYAQYGSLTGRPILYQHGLPGSRIEAAAFDELGQKYEARIIATDRPGYGWSSPHPDRTLLDHPKDLECLAEHLGLEEYCVLGISGGGPYALACAMALPRDKLKCVSIVCGLGPPDIGMSGADFVHWVGFTFGWRYARPIFIRWFFQREPAARLDLSDEERLELTQQLVAKSEATAHESDLKVFKDMDFLRLYLRSARESYAQGFDWVTQDGRLVASDFGFRIEDIRPDLPVQLWYGKHDRFVPLNHGEQIAARLGERAHLRVEDESHAGVSQNLKEEILKALIQSP